MSETKIIVRLRSQETKKLFKVFKGRFQNCSLFNVARFKIDSLFQYAKMKHVYAHIWLLQIKMDLVELMDELDAGIKKIEKAILKNHGELREFDFLKSKKCEFMFTNSLIYNMVEILKRLDRINCLIVLAHRLDIFKTRKSFFMAKSRYMNHFNKVIGKIINKRVLELPKITFDDYFNNTEVYRQACEEFGKIDPQSLYNAINLMDLPFLEEKEFRQVSVKLREMLE